MLTPQQLNLIINYQSLQPNLTSSFDGTIYTISQAQYDPNTGRPVAPIVYYILAADLQSVSQAIPPFQSAIPVSAQNKIA
jgi:hypothetical protein